jgi:hypothetical protein
VRESSVNTLRGFVGAVVPDFVRRGFSSISVFFWAWACSKVSTGVVAPVSGFRASLALSLQAVDNSPALPIIKRHNVRVITHSFFILLNKVNHIN